ncbi:hypothetical protein MMC13_001797 [Lambiella insularis]|nr:hypothetical protein [Lambiella insularis]
MSAAGKGHLSVQTLTDDAKEATPACGTWLRSAPFRPIGDYEICDNNDGLLSSSHGIIKNLPPSKSTSETRVAACRFQKAATLHVNEGSTVELIPIIVAGSPTVSGQSLQVGQYLLLTKNVVVEPELYCLLRLAQ